MAKNKTPQKVQKWKKSKVKKLNKWNKIKKKNKELILEWSGRGWTAKIVENEDGGGWACEMYKDGHDQPVYVAPWTMGRNKVDPKPLSLNAFNTWVKSASEFLMRSQMHKRIKDRTSFTITTEDGEQLKVIFDIDRGDYQSVGVLTAEDVFGEEIARAETYPRFELTIDAAEAWVASDFAAPTPPDDPAVAQVPLAEDDVWDPDAEPAEDDNDAEIVYEPLGATGGGSDGDGDEVFEEEIVYEDAYVQTYEEPVFEYD